MLRRPGLLCLLLTLFGSVPTFAFTQRSISIFGAGDVVPMGHEWITRTSAIELIGYAPGTVPDCKPGTGWCDPNDPRRGWPKQGLAQRLDLSSAEAQREVARIKGLTTDESTFLSRYKPIQDAILGERWVDITGYNVATSQYCWTAVAQEAVDAQYDHFMRKWNEFEGQGGLTAAEQSRARFITYFVNAAMAPPTSMYAYDGGAGASKAMIVDRNYFLFGRAVHLLQDSFSSEHTVRRKDLDFNTRVHQVLSYMCAKGAEQHTHSTDAVLDFTSGDVIWKVGTRFEPGWASYRASNMKDLPLSAMEASKDLWAAFIRTMGTPMDRRRDVANQEATALADYWLSFTNDDVLTWYDKPEHRGPTFVANNTDVTVCMKTIDKGKYTDPAKRAADLVEARRQCVFNHKPWTGYQDLADPSTNMYYSWRWLNGPTSAMSPAPNGWQPPQLAADTGRRVRIKSVLNGGYVGTDSVAHQSWLWAGRNPALDFIIVGPNEDATFRVTSDPRFFLSYKGTADGTGQLWDFSWGTTDPSNFAIELLPGAVALKQIYWKQYLWVDSDRLLHLNRYGDRNNPNSQWVLESQ